MRTKIRARSDGSCAAAAPHRAPEQIPSVRLESLHYRPRAAIAASLMQCGDAPELLRIADKATRRLAREPGAAARAIALLQAASIAHLRGNADAAGKRLREPIDASETAELGCYGTVARRHLSTLVGGDEDRALVENADVWMRRQNIVQPERFAFMLGPGFAS